MSKGYIELVWKHEGHDDYGMKLAFDPHVDSIEELATKLAALNIFTINTVKQVLAEEETNDE